MKKTIFHPLHDAAGAKFGPFAGYCMPLFYPLGIMKEHLHTRAHAGLFDISHMVHLEVSGPDAGKMISSACPYIAEDQEIRSAKYTFMLNEDAGIIDDLIVTRLGDDRFLVVSNAACADNDEAHLGEISKDFDAEIARIDRAFLALQGPKAEAALEKAALNCADLDFMTGREPQPGWFLSRTGYTGEDGFEIAIPNDYAIRFAEKLLADERVEWIGLGARDSLRLEAGLSLYGQDLSETITPHEAGLIWAIPKPLREGGNYIGATTLAAKIKSGRKRKRIGLKPVDRTPVRAGANLTDSNGEELGVVTSGGFGPTVGGPVALALVTAEFDGDELFAQVRGKQVAVRAEKLPFITPNYKN